MELILLTFLAFGHPFCLWVSEVCFLVFWEWKSCQDPMLECAQNIVNTDVFDRFRFFDFFMNFESFGRPEDTFG